MQILRFEWQVGIEVPNDFDKDDEAQWQAALHKAWLQVQEKDGELIYEGPKI
jgi:uncharacterized protein YciI